MAYELGVLSDVQTGDVLTSTNDITIAWVATSIDGSHLNEVHTCVPGSLYVLELNQLPSGTTEDCYTHLTESINRIVSTYCTCFNQDYVSVKKKCTHTFRAL